MLSKARIPRLLIICILIAFAALLLFARAMDRDINHDEHQFLAPAALIQQGLLPYRDFAIFHLPNVSLLYAVILPFTDHPFLGAKLLSALATVVLVATILVSCGRGTFFGSTRWSLPFAAFVALLLLSDPLFLRTTGKTWNHEIPTAFAILAFIAHRKALLEGRAMFVFLSGMGLGLAIGSRLTFLPLAFPFSVSIWFIGERTPQERAKLFGTFCLAGILAMLPTLCLFASSPDNFLFDNLQFPRVRLLDASDTRAHETATWWRKGRYFLKEVLRPSWAIFGLTLLAAVLKSRDKRREERGQLWFHSLTLPFVALGCALPTRYQYQHWYPLIPFLSLTLVDIATLGTLSRLHRNAFAGITGVVCSISVLLSFSEYRVPMVNIAKPNEWFPMKFHAEAAMLKEHVQEGRILTLAPAWPMEAGLSFYPEFATGPFAWRLAHLVEPSRRRVSRLIAPEDLDTFLKPNPPAAILTGIEESALEEPLIEYATRNSYQKVQFQKKRVLWLAPSLLLRRSSQIY